MRTDPRLIARRSFLFAFLGPLLPHRLRFAGARMTIADDLEWLFRWCGCSGLPAAA